MNVSSVSSSTLWEEYLEKLKEQKKETSAVATRPESAQPKTDIRPEALLAELEALQDDPDALKARAAEMAAQVSEAAGRYVDARGDMLKKFAADLETVASDGDLSTIREKLPGRGMNGGPAGLNGAASASASYLQALLAEEETADEESDELDIDRIKELLAELNALIAGTDDAESSADASQFDPNLAPDELLAELEAIEDDPEKLKAKAKEMAEQISAIAQNRTGRFSRPIEELASDLYAVAESGDLSEIREKLARGSNGGAGTGNDVSIGPSDIFSKFRSLRESASETSSAEEAGQASIDSVMASIRANLSNMLNELYSQSRTTYPSISMSA